MRALRFLVAWLALFAGVAVAGPYDLLLNQRNSTDDGNIQRIPLHPSTPGLLAFDSSTLLPLWVTLGTGLSISSGVLNVSAGGSPACASITDATVTGCSLLTAANAAAARTAIGAGTSSFDGVFGSLTSKPTTLAGYGITDAYPLTGNPAGFLTGITGSQVVAALGYTPGSSTGTVTSVTAGTGLSGGTITTSGTISLPNTGTAGTYAGVTTDAQGRVTAGTNRSFNFTTRAVNTCFQVSSTRDALVTYSVDISATLSLTTGQVGTVYLRTYTNSSCTTGAQEVTRFVNGNSGSLTIGLNLTQNVTGTLTGIVQGGLWIRLDTENTTGTPAFTARPGQEVLL